ncbi:MAG: hypothetical protein WCF84_05795 [Anaerolineae bacterium]
MPSSDLNLTSEILWQSALFTALIDLALVLFLLWRIKPRTFHELKWAIVAVSSISWGVLAVALLYGFWDSYYRYFYPDSARWLSAIIVVVFGVNGFVLWWLALRLPGNPTATFCLLGGVEGLLEHAWGIYGLGILVKVPMLQNAGALSIFVFSFFEYVFYWGIVLGIAALVSRAWREWKKQRQGQAKVA